MAEGSLPAQLDRDAFLSDMYRRLVGALCLQGFAVEEAEDLAQDTLVRVIRNWDQVVAADSPQAWVFHAASNVARSWLRRLRASRRRSAPRPQPTPGDPSEGIAVRDAVSRLPPRQREAVVLRYFGGLSTQEAATVMGCAEGTVRALTSQGVASLRTRFDITTSETPND